MKTKQVGYFTYETDLGYRADLEVVFDMEKLTVLVKITDKHGMETNRIEKFKTYRTAHNNFSKHLGICLEGGWEFRMIGYKD